MPASRTRRSLKAISLRTRITGVALVVVALALAAGAVAVVWTLSAQLTASVTTRVGSELESLGDGLDDGMLTVGYLAERDDDLLVAWHDGSNIVVNDDDASAMPVPRGGDPLRASIDDETYLVMSEELDGGVLIVGASLQEVDDAVVTTAALLAIAVPIAVIVIGIVLWAVSTRALAPVERIRRQVDDIDAGALDRRVPTTGRGDEIDRLATTMNRMLGRVEEGYRARQRFVGDASHELRSPLATMRQFAELTRMHPHEAPPTELADVVLTEGARMQDIVEGLLLLARLDERAVRVSGVTDFDDLALAEVQRVRSLGARTVDGRGIVPVPAVGDERLLARAVRNLVDNAVRHSRTTVTISTGSDGARAFVCVDDDGDGVTPEDRERVFERFVRLDEARSRDAGGSGLGLAIVREIALAHGGSVRVETSPSGGARFVLDVPLAGA